MANRIPTFIQPSPKHVVPAGFNVRSLFTGTNELPGVERDNALILLARINGTRGGSTAIQMAAELSWSSDTMHQAILALTSRNLVKTAALRGDQVVWMDHHPWPEVLLPTAKALYKAVLDAVPRGAACTEAEVMKDVVARFPQHRAPAWVMEQRIRAILKTLVAERRLATQTVARIDGPQLSQVTVWRRAGRQRSNPATCGSQACGSL